jgi:DNA-binding response OmpR family regulator
MIILAAEDDPEDFEFFQEALLKINPSIVVFRADTGVQVLEILKNGVFTPDYIFLDINMPRMDGHACFKELRKNERYQRIPVIVYSTSKNVKEISHFQSQGATFLVKPDNFDQLVKSLEIILGYSRQARSGW